MYTSTLHDLIYDCHSSDNMIVNECKGWELGVCWLGQGDGYVGLVHIGWGALYLRMVWGLSTVVLQHHYKKHTHTHELIAITLRLRARVKN